MEHTMKNAAPRIAVLGTGANGSAIGVDLVRAGLDVTFIDQWPANVEAIRRDGVRVELAGETTVTPVEILHLCEVATLRRPFDVVLLLVKAYDTRWAAELIAPYLADDGVVVGVQNGMTGEAIADVVGEHRAVGAVIEITSAMYTPGVVERHSAHDRSWFAVGAVHPAAAHHVETVAGLLRHAGTVEATDDIDSAKWMKLILNAAELVPSAILDLSIADCARYPGMRELMLEAGNEAVRAAQLDGATIRPIFGMPDTTPETFVETVLDELLAHYILTHSRSTVLQDWIKGRHSEVDELNGHVVATLEQHGESAPANAAMVELAHDIERGELTRGTELFEPLRARTAELRTTTTRPNTHGGN
ncbi:ketopantoate reductase family protein [Herbiconiux daphne]|uniref:2-dehydropantoate 2-reductase n=1 Tax=Herbiconiux daphne TaxID=2970914 RepID=A0ABT2H5J5_9MICO|nr:2-dehydropantoate 2-reductase [Herbiconiux daphne]MCS5735173.1 2-dehydropantoate 2-reductase [Herbiconiux daphne]